MGGKQQRGERNRKGITRQGSEEQREGWQVALPEEQDSESEFKSA